MARKWVAGLSIDSGPFGMYTGAPASDSRAHNDKKKLYVERSDDELTFHVFPWSGSLLASPFFCSLLLLFFSSLLYYLLFASPTLFTLTDSLFSLTPLPLSILFRVHIVLMQLSYDHLMNSTLVPL